MYFVHFYYELVQKVMLLREVSIVSYQTHYIDKEHISKLNDMKSSLAKKDIYIYI